MPGHEDFVDCETILAHGGGVVFHHHSQRSGMNVMSRVHKFRPLGRSITSKENKASGLEGRHTYKYPPFQFLGMFYAARPFALCWSLMTGLFPTSKSISPSGVMIQPVRSLHAPGFGA